jgi:hypothetical protein
MALLAIVAMAFFNAGSLHTDNLETHSTEQPDLSKAACTEIAALASKFSGLTISQSVGSVHDDRTDSDHIGCRIVGFSDGIHYRGYKWPHDILRMRMTSEEWREDISRAADGAGSTAFALRKGTSLCLFSAIWDANDSSEPDAVATNSYRVEVGCFELSEGR